MIFSNLKARCHFLIERDLDRGLDKIVYVNKDHQFSDDEVKDRRTYFGMSPNGPMTPELKEKIDLWKRKRKVEGVSPYLKKFSPLPINATQMVSSVLFDAGKLTENSLSEDEKNVLVKAVDNAIKRTGKNKGRTLYTDYGDIDPSYGTAEGFDRKGVMVENLNREGFLNNAIGQAKDFYHMTKQSATNPAFRMATTLGRFNYYKDDNGKIHITDFYDFIIYS